MIEASPLRICVISLHYYPDYVERSLKSVNALSGILKPSARVLISNNAEITERLRREPAGSGCVAEVIPHDNTGQEFGAYQAGLDRARLTYEADWYVFLNDTFSIHECFATPLRDGFAQAIRAAGRSSLPIIVGQVDEMPRSFLLGGCRTHRWVRSSVMALNSVAVQTLDFRLYQPRLDDFIKASTEVEEFFAIELDPVLRERLATWLFSRNEHWGWYRAAELSTASAERLARKARSILQEKYLSARLDQASAVFIDIKRMSFANNVRRGMERRIFLWRNRSRR